MSKGWEAQTVGRRKSSVARVCIRKGSGSITVNKKHFDEYFGRETLRMVLKQPLVALGVEENFDILINVHGGGSSGQAGAARHGIARALVAVDEENRTPLKSRGFLTRDDRRVERKKYGHHKARKKPQFSKR